MIRLRIGQHWKREPVGAPMDSVGLSVHGVDLLAGASEEPLAEVVPALVEGVHAVALGGRQLAQVTLPEAHVELLLARHNGEVELKVVSLARPARLVRRAVRVDAEDLARAVGRGARALLEELRVRSPGLVRSARLRAMEKQLSPLEQGELGWPSRSGSRATAPLVLPPPAPLGFGATLEDPEGLLAGFRRGGGAALASLLCDGTVFLQVDAVRAWQAAGPPFLVALELSRQAAEVLHALETGEAQLQLAPGGLAPALTLALSTGRLRDRGEPLAVDGRALAAAMYELGLALSLLVVGRHPAQAANPYLRELRQRCQEGLARLRPSPPAPSPSEVAARPRARRPAAAEARPLEAGARLRRLRFERQWERHETATGPTARLLLGRGGPLVVGREAVRAFSSQGEPLWAHTGSHGVAATAGGHVLVATESRALLFADGEPAARWLRDHDGLPLGPELEEADGLLLTASEGRTLLAFSTLTGRELWRLAAPRTTRCWPAVQGHRVLVATDSGNLYGLDAQDGQLRFRLRSALPFAGPVRPWGRRMVALLAQGEHTALYTGDAHTGAAQWTRELPLASPTLPLVQGRVLFVLGQRGEDALLVCLDAAGQVRWERPLPLGPPPYALTPFERGVLAASGDGTVARVAADGKLAWRVGGSGEALPVALAPQVKRRVALVAGQAMRAVDPLGGDLLAEMELHAPPRDFAVDARLTLYVLDEDGTLTAWKLVGQLGVV